MRPSLVRCSPPGTGQAVARARGPVSGRSPPSGSLCVRFGRNYCRVCLPKLGLGGVRHTAWGVGLGVLEAMAPREHAGSLLGCGGRPGREVLGTPPGPRQKARGAPAAPLSLCSADGRVTEAGGGGESSRWSGGGSGRGSACCDLRLLGRPDHSLSLPSEPRLHTRRGRRAAWPPLRSVSIPASPPCRISAGQWDRAGVCGQVSPVCARASGGGRPFRGDSYKWGF